MMFKLSAINVFVSLCLLSFVANVANDQTIACKSLPKLVKKKVEHELLRMFGLREQPRVQSQDSFVPSYMRQMYENLVSNDFDYERLVSESDILNNNSIDALHRSDAIISIQNQAYELEPAGRRLLFDVHQFPVDYLLISAELRIFRTSPSSYSITRGPFVVSLHDVTKEGTAFVTSTTVSPGDRGWLVFDVTEITMKWMKHPLSNNGLEISISDLSNDMETTIDEANLLLKSESKELRPFLLCYFRDNGESMRPRIRRDIAEDIQADEESRAVRERASKPSGDFRSDLSFGNQDEPHESGKSCRLKELYIDFKDLGWQEWILAPKGYEAKACTGECSFPLSTHMNATNHAIVQTLMHILSPRIVPKPCCAPTKLDSISVLFHDDNSNAVLKTYRKMIVSSCGCH